MICLGNFSMSNAYTISSTTKWGGTSRFLQDIIVCTKYAPFHQLPSRALSGFSRVLLSVRRMYHAQPTIVGLAQAQPNSHLMLKSSINVLYSLNRSHGVNLLWTPRVYTSQTLHCMLNIPIYQKTPRLTFKEGLYSRKHCMHTDIHTE